ncbi:acid protease [Meredithblackwellia eburnea MCA 4105]
MEDSLSHSTFSFLLSLSHPKTFALPFANESQSQLPLPQSASLPPTSIILHKQGVPVTNEDGTANLAALKKHLVVTREKYQSTIAAYLLNTGTPLGVLLPAEEVFDSSAGTRNSSTTRPTSSREKRNNTKQDKEKRQALPLADMNNDLLWAGHVGVGTPPQDFLVMFDTGSSDFFVPSTYCTGQAACQEGNKYDPDLSTTAQPQKGTFSIVYGDGSSTSGPIYTDTITIGAFSAPSQYFSPVTELSDSFAQEPEDGIMGMAYPSISNIKARHQVLASARPFGFRMSKPSGGSSELFLGGANPSRYSGDVEWHPVLKQAYYNISMEPIIGTSTTMSRPGSRTAVIDTGTTVILAPPGEAQEFWSKVPGAAKLSSSSGGSTTYYTYNCASPPTVSFQFSASGKLWKVSPADLNLGRVSVGSPRCVGAITGSDVGLGDSTWILGCSFLKNVYSVFDRTVNRVGFAVPA